MLQGKAGETGNGHPKILVSDDRAAHWIRNNHQCRIPKRWIAFDTESKSRHNGDTEIQSWAMGAAIRWRTDLKRPMPPETNVFNSAYDLWQWVTNYCRRGVRTVAWAHNLGYDVRIAQALDILPQLGWKLEWCNLDRNVSAMTWRSDRGTLVLADTWTWLPTDLGSIAPSVGLQKLTMPPHDARRWQWEKYCVRDAEIVYRVVSELIGYIKSEDLGNWQPTGAGMSYATWRHKYLTHKVLVHSDTNAIACERAAMHTGRAEAWKHGKLEDTTWIEVDMRNAYVTIAAECDMPVKLKYKTGAISLAQYDRLKSNYKCLCLCDVETDTPVVPYHNGTRTLWPVGRFNTYLWDTEINVLRDAGAHVSLRNCIVYTRAPVLQAWAVSVLSALRDPTESISPVVKTWLKHCSRALIGRLALRVTRWEEFGTNPMGDAHISHYTDMETGETHKLLHIGTQTFRSSARVEGKDSLPQVTGWIMAECRTRLWQAMIVAGLDEIAHVDTDSMLVSPAGLQRLQEHLGNSFGQYWQVKGARRRVTVYGPRNYRWGPVRKAAGIPSKATETAPNVFTGEVWQGVAACLEQGMAGNVVIVPGTWSMKVSDPRRRDGVGAATLPYAVGVASAETSAASSSSISAIGL